MDETVTSNTLSDVKSYYRILKKTWDEVGQAEYHIQKFRKFNWLQRWYYGFQGRWEDQSLIFYSNSATDHDRVYAKCVEKYEELCADEYVRTVDPIEETIKPENRR